MKKIFSFVLIVLSLNFFCIEKSAKSEWEFLSTETIKAKEFINKHPEYDGRGVLIAVCDSGVDLGLSGLLKTSDGKEKIVDARDFSGQYSYKAETPIIADDGSIYLKDEKRLYNLEKVLPNVDKRKVYVGYLKEKDAKNSEVKDLNGNKKEDDVFGFVLYLDGDKWKVLIDSDGDGDLYGEKSYLDFSEGKEFFALKGKDRFSDYVPFNIAVNIDSEKKEVSFFVADGSHGTHVAGIAAGYKIDNQEGFNGIAPGAQILALKIGNNAYSGGATTSGSMVSAWRYAVKKAKELNMPLVIQMSYGIGSEIEGRAEAEKLIDELLDENPDVVATVSFGNEGPGLSTSGLPASAKDVLAVGAVIAKTTAKDIYGADLKQDELFSFSSRGGEIAKPDFVCPGFAAATVPLWEEGKNVMRGTSMASPQAAGACALLLSAIKSENLPIRRDIVYSALRRGCEELSGYTFLDQGYGLLNIEKSYEIYKQLVKNVDDVFDYEVETKCPRYEDLKGMAVYYRGAYYPKSGERQEIKVFPKFPIDFSEEKKVKFFKAFDIEKSGDFFTVVQGSTFMKSKEPAKIYVTFNENALKNPGLYTGKVSLYPKKFSEIEKKNLKQDLVIPITVIVPFETSEKDGSYNESTVSVEKAKVKRLFYRVKGDYPVTFKISTKEKPEGKVAVQLFDPSGREKEYLILSNEKRELEVLINPPCESGVYELDLYGNYLNTKAVNVKVEGKEIRLSIKAKDELKIKSGEGGKSLLQINSQLKDVLRCSVSAQITGYSDEKTESNKSSDYSRSFSIAGNEEAVSFELEMNEKDFNLFTDIAVQILDEDGKSLVSDGMTYRFLKISAGRGDGLKEGKKYKLLVSAAYANPDEEKKWNLKVKETHQYRDAIGGKIKEEESLEIYPDIPKELSVAFSSPPPAVSSTSSYLLKIDFQDKVDKGIKFSRDVLLKQEK
jgi:subtilisin family serine protease